MAQAAARRVAVGVELPTQQALTGRMPGSALAEQLVVKNWESKHENADDCYEAQNIQVAGIATPQDEMQKQKEVYALRMYQQRNLEWRRTDGGDARLLPRGRRSASGSALGKQHAV